jgi:hypothetical protein
MKNHIIIAGSYLSAGAENDVETMVELIKNNADQNQLIDYVDGVDVWEKVEFEFTCNAFLKLIGYGK